MTRTLAALLALGLAACGNEPAPKSSPPKPAAQATPTPQTTPAPTVQSSTPEPAKPDPNKELATKVKRALEGEAKIQAAGIDVTASGGKVTLWGTAATAGERDRAAKAAAKVDGVSSVENKIAVVKGS